MKVKLSIQITAIIILVFIVAILAMVLFLRENQHTYDLNKATTKYNYQQERYLKNMSIRTDKYNKLYADFNELDMKYSELAGSKGFYEDWEEYEVTGYTSSDKGCNNITSIGLDLDKDWTKYFDFVAVDPNEIPYGSTVLAKFEDGIIRSGLAVDCGYKIKGKKIDWYCDTLYEALAIGRRTLEVKVID